LAVLLQELELDLAIVPSLVTNNKSWAVRCLVGEVKEEAKLLWPGLVNRYSKNGQWDIR